MVDGADDGVDADDNGKALFADTTGDDGAAVNTASEAIQDDEG